MWNSKLIFAMLLCGMAFTPATVQAMCWQFDATHVADDLIWPSEGGEAALRPVHGGSNGWSHAGTTVEVARGVRRGVVSFEEGSSPFEFSESATNFVREVWAVVRCREAAGLATLLDAPVDARFEARVFEEEALRLQDEQLGNRSGYRVNGVAQRELAAAEELQLVEVVFETPVRMNEIFVGGAAASWRWGRGWRGEIGELMFFERELSPAEREAVGDFVALKWGVAAGKMNVGVLWELGIRTGSLYSTLLMVR